MKHSKIGVEVSASDSAPHDFRNNKVTVRATARCSCGEGFTATHRIDRADLYDDGVLRGAIEAAAATAETQHSNHSQRATRA